MNYELAKKLKDAGFSQKFKTGYYYAEKDLTFKEAQIAHTFFDERRRRTPESELVVKNCISIPTLSELIEACGDRFEFLRQWPDLRWDAQAGQIEPDKTWSSNLHETPEEAVAHLFLELNKIDKRSKKC